MIYFDCDCTYKKKMNVLDLFCGCGGFTKGLIDAGLNVVAGIDIWDKAVDNYKQNHKHICICNNLKTYHPCDFVKESGIREVDIIVGGPPCQGFSVAGKRDVNDPRNSLIMNYIEYVKYFHPKAFCMENVYGILSMKTEEGEYIIDVIKLLLQDEYNITVNKLSAQYFEVPQNRKRVIIIGFQKGLGIPEEIKPFTDDIIPVKNILEDNVDRKYYLSEKAITGINNKKQKSKENGNGFGAQFLDMNKPSFTIPARYYKDGYDALVKYDEQNIRKLTITELKRIQTFGDDYILNGTNKDIIMQIGNAIPCKLAYHIGLYLQKELSDKVKIIQLFNNNIKNKSYSPVNKNHCGSEGYWLEQQFGIKNNNNNAPDIYGYELKKESKTISFGDYSASEYLFSKHKPFINIYCKLYGYEPINVTRSDFMKYFGSYNYDKERYSWSGSCIPKFFKWNNYGQTFVVNNNDDLMIIYNSKYDKMHNDIPDIFVNKYIVLAIWKKEKLSENINKKFNQKGFIICKKDSGKYSSIHFGKPINYDIFLQFFKENIIFFDSGMYDGNNRNYSHFRAHSSFWNKLLLE